jgi:two-component system C4-dicarboxylate transport response regulator DctD
MDGLVQSLKRAATQRKLVLENRHLRQLYLESKPGRTQLIGDSQIMQHLRQNLERVADTDVDILIVGDTGVGKERAARALHDISARRNRPFIQVNCAAMPEETYAFELFGAEPGSKLGAYGPIARRAVGRLEKAQRGTLFLDEIEGLSLAQQARLLHLIEAREFWPLGAQEPRALDVRVIVASKADLAGLVATGRFRADLFYRLSSFMLRVPPLSERREDIGPLFRHFLAAACARFKRPIPEIGPRVHAHLINHDWPGNVRELEHFAERFALGLFELAPVDGAGEAAPGLAERVADYEAELIRQTLRVTSGSAKKTMQSLKLPSKTFYDKLGRYRIQIGDYRS